MRIMMWAVYVVRDGRYDSDLPAATFADEKRARAYARLLGEEASVVPVHLHALPVTDPPPTVDSPLCTGTADTASIVSLHVGTDMATGVGAPSLDGGAFVAHANGDVATVWPTDVRAKGMEEVFEPPPT